MIYDVQEFSLQLDIIANWSLSVWRFSRLGFLRLWNTKYLINHWTVTDYSTNHEQSSASFKNSLDWRWRCWKKFDNEQIYNWWLWWTILPHHWYVFVIYCRLLAISVLPLVETMLTGNLNKLSRKKISVLCPRLKCYKCMA